VYFHSTMGNQVVMFPTGPFTGSHGARSIERERIPIIKQDLGLLPSIHYMAPIRLGHGGTGGI